MATIREQLRDDVLVDRKDRAKQTKFDAELKIERDAGRSIRLPTTLRPEGAAKAIQAWADSEQQTVTVQEVIKGIPIDAAHALQLATEHEYGVRELKAQQTFFGENPPPFLNVPIDCGGNSVDVYVGEFSLPGLEGARFRSYPSGPLELTIAGKLRRKDQALFRQLVATAREMLVSHSLYKGKAIIVDFDQADDGELVIPTFWDVRNPKPLVLNDATHASIESELWTPIEMADEVRAMGTPIKRTVLLHGPFGTGKTLVAYETARRAVANGFTVLYVKNMEHFDRAIEFASAQYPPCVLFVEDADMVFADPGKLNDLQNIIDGIDGKDREVITIMTSNFVEKLPSSILRPGRIDSVIPMPPSNPKAAAELVVLYAGDKLASDADMARIGKAVQGKIPAVVREIVERSKLSALRRSMSIVDSKGQPIGLNFKIDHIDIETAAEGMNEHLRLLYDRRVKEPTATELMGSALGREIMRGMSSIVEAVVLGQPDNEPFFETDEIAQIG